MTYYLLDVSKHPRRILKAEWLATREERLKERILSTDLVGELEIETTFTNIDQSPFSPHLFSLSILIDGFFILYSCYASYASLLKAKKELIGE